jgi:MtN3 and saliva related transmembrane protein
MGLLSLNLAIGLFGVVLLIAAWLWETYEDIRKRKMQIHTHFALLYILGNVLLTIYAWLIASSVFFWLNVILITAVIFELAYSFKLKKRKK